MQKNEIHSDVFPPMWCAGCHQHCLGFFLSKPNTIRALVDWLRRFPVFRQSATDLNLLEVARSALFSSCNENTTLNPFWLRLMNVKSKEIIQINKTKRIAMMTNGRFLPRIPVKHDGHSSEWTDARPTPFRKHCSWPGPESHWDCLRTH